MPSFASAIRVTALVLFSSTAAMLAAAAPQAAPKPVVEPIGFYVFTGSGAVPPSLQEVVPTQSQGGGRFWVGEATRTQLNDLVGRGLAPVYLAPGRSNVGAATETVDTDGDGLSNDLEAIYHTDPNNPDTDQDFLSDGDEVNTYGTWPLRESSDGDRYDDGQEILGFSPWGLGQLGGDMPGYVLAPGNQPLVAAYPKIDFEIVDNIEMQANQEETIGTKTITTETKTKSTMNRRVVVTSYGEESNYIRGNQGANSTAALEATAARIAANPTSAVSSVNQDSGPLLIEERSMAGPGSFDFVDGEACLLAKATGLACDADTGLDDPRVGQSSRQGSFATVDPLYDRTRLNHDNQFESFYSEKPGGPFTLSSFIVAEEWQQAKLVDPVALVGLAEVFLDAAGVGVPITTLYTSLESVGRTIQANAAENAALFLARDSREWFLSIYTNYLVTCNASPVEVDLLELNADGRRYEDSCQRNLVGAAAWSPYAADPCAFAKSFSRNGNPNSPSLPRLLATVQDEAAWADLLSFMASGLVCPRASSLRVAEPIQPPSHGPLGGTPFDVGGHLSSSGPSFGSGQSLAVEINGALRSSRFFDTGTLGGVALVGTIESREANRDVNPKATTPAPPCTSNCLKAGESSKKISKSRTELNETIVTSTYSWSVSKEDWTQVTTNSSDFGTLTFSFTVRNKGADLALDTTGLRFNLQIGDNPATPEVEAFNPITFPRIQSPAITFSNLGPGDQLTFGASVSLQKYQFRALDEGASLKISVADYSYGTDELFYRSASGGGVTFEIDYGVLEPDSSRRAEFIVPIQQIWDELYGGFRSPTYAEVLSTVVPVVDADGAVTAIGGRPVTSSAWWSVLLNKEGDQSLFGRSTAVPGSRVVLQYHGDEDGDGYADSVELERGTDPRDASAHPTVKIVAGLVEATDASRPGWTKAYFRVANTGTYEAWGLEGRVFAADSEIEVGDSTVGGSGLIVGGGQANHEEDVFWYKKSGGKSPLLEIRYSDPEGLHILLSTVVLPSLSADLTPYEGQMVPRGRITAEAPSAFYYDQSQTVKVGYSNPTNKTIEDAWIAVDWQSLMGDILSHEDRQLDLAPGSNYATFSFKPEEHLAPINIGGQFKALVRVMDHNGALIDSKVAYMVAYPRAADVTGASAPRLALSESSWNVGSVVLGEERTKTITIANLGGEPLDAVFASDSPNLSVKPSSVLGLPPAGTQTVTLRFRSAGLEPGSFACQLIVASSDPVSTTSGFQITANLVSPDRVVTLFSVEGRPWDRRLFIHGSYPAGTSLYFDHNFDEEPERVVPLVLWNSERTVALAEGEDWSSLSPYLRRTSSTGRQISLTLPWEIEGGYEFILQFGKRYPTAPPPSRALEGSVLLPRETLESARVTALLSRETTYDDFDLPDISPSAWTVAGTGVAEILPLGSLHLRVACSFCNTPLQKSVTSTRDFKSSPDLNIFEFGVGNISLAGDPYPYGATARFDLAIGSTVLRRREAAYNLGIPAFVGKLVFSVENNTVSYYEDETLVGTFSLAAQPTWSVRFEVSLVSVDVSGSVWSESTIEWTRHYGAPQSWTFKLNSTSAPTWEVSAQLAQSPGADQLLLLTSPDIAAELNAALSSTPGSGQTASVPYSLHQLGFMGPAILTDLVLERSPSNSAANLRVDGIEVHPPSISWPGAVTLTAVVENSGQDSAGPFVVTFFDGDPSDGGAVLREFLSTGLASLSSRTFEFTWNGPSGPGERSIWVVADPTDALLETVETDNQALVALNVSPTPDLLIEGDGVSVSPPISRVGQRLRAEAHVRNTGTATLQGVSVELFQDAPALGGVASDRRILTIPGGGSEKVELYFAPESAGVVEARLVVDRFNYIAESDESNNTALGSALIEPGSAVSRSISIDCGDGGLSDRPYSLGSGFGYLNGSDRTDWGSDVHQTVRYGFGGAVTYRLSGLNPSAIYHLNATFFEGDGAGRVMGVWIDGEDTTRRAHLAGGVLRRVSVRVPPTAYASDGSIEVELRRDGPGDAVVSELRLAEVTYRYLDSGDGGATDVPYTAGLGYGHLNGSISTAWGAAPERSVRYSTTSDVVYEFDGLEATKNYRVGATLFENDGAGRVETLRADEASSAPVTLSATPQEVLLRVPNAAYSVDGSIVVRVRRSAGPNTVVSEVWLEEETLPYRALSGGTVTPATGSGSTAFDYSVIYTDDANLLPDTVTVSVDGGSAQALAAADTADLDARDGKRYHLVQNGLTNGLHAFRFGGTLGGAPLTGDVGSHAGPLVGGFTLPEAGAWGLIPGGDTAHARSVSYAFGGFSEPVHLGFELYDVDGASEVELLVNGVSLGFGEITGNGAWGGARSWLLAPGQLRALETNHLEFLNTLNASGGSEPWGVRAVSLLPARPEGLTVADVVGDNGEALRVSWTSSADDGARLRNVTAYRAYRAAAPAGPFVLAGSTNPGETVFVDAGRTAGETRWYEVVATNGLGESAVPLLAMGTALDNLPPGLSGVSPPDGATGVPATAPVIFHLADSGTGVDPLSVAVRVNGAYAYATLSGTAADTVASVALPDGQTPGQTVTVTVGAADRATPANSFEGASFAFTVAGDIAPPYIASSSPGDGATGVDPATSLAVTLRDDGAGLDAASVVLRVNGILVQPDSSENTEGLLLTYQPPTPFTAGQTVTLQVSASDLASPANAGIDTVAFTVGSTGGPVIVAAAPAGSPRALAASAVPFRVTAEDPDSDKMGAAWTVDGSPTTSGVTFNGANGGNWTSTRTLTISAPASAKVDEQVAVVVSTPSTTSGDYLGYDDFATLSAAWTFFNGGGTNPAPTASGALAMTTSNSSLAQSIDTYSFLYRQAPVSTNWGSSTRLTAASSGTADVGAGLLLKVDADTWYFAGSMVVGGVRKAGLLYQTNGQSTALFTATETDPALFVRLVREGSLVIASYRKASGGGWIELGRAPILVSGLLLGPAVWNPSATAASNQFDDFRMWNGTPQPATPVASGLVPPFNDLRVTEGTAAGERQVAHLLRDANNDGFAESLVFHADTAPGGPPYAWKVYKVYYGNSLATDLAASALPGADSGAETVTFGSAIGVTGSSFDWTATPAGSHSVHVTVSDGTASDTHDWTVTVVQNVPATPMRLTAVGGDGKVYLSWLPSDELNVAGYNVYRAGVKINGAALGLAAYTDSGRTNGVQACYTVRAVNGSGTESADSTQACATSGDDTIPAAPLRLKATPDDHVVALTWLPAWQPDVAGYSVFRRVGGSGNFVKLNGALVVPALYSDTTVTNFTAYEYHVTAVDQSGHESIPSEIVAATPQPMAPAAPTSLAGANNAGVVQLTWVASAGPNLAGYNVYRSFVSGVGYQKLNVSLVPSPSYGDSTAIEGVEYFYVVRAVGTSGAESGASNEVSVTPNAPPFAPTNLSATGGNRRVLLSWNANGEPDLAGYFVLRGLSAGGPYTRITPTALTTPEFTDQGLEVGRPYFYVVRAVDERGSESSNSSEASAQADLAFILVVHDEGDVAYAPPIREAVSESGRYFDEWDVRTQGSPGLAALQPYRIVLWNLGPEFAATLQASDQAALSSYLGAGGRLALFGQDLMNDLGGSNPFVRQFLHVTGATLDSCGTTVFGVAGDHLSNGMQLALSPPFVNGCDRLTLDASAKTVFTGAGGMPVAVRTNDGIYPMTAFFAVPFEGISTIEPDPNNQSMLVRRIIDWLALDPRVYSDDFEGGSIAKWSAVLTAK